MYGVACVSVWLMWLFAQRRGSFYPGTGAAAEVGVGAGAGFNVNVAWSGPGMVRMLPIKGAGVVSSDLHQRPEAAQGMLTVTCCSAAQCVRW